MIKNLPKSLIEAATNILNKKTSIYQEEPDSTVTHNGVEYNINKLYRLADQHMKYVSVSDIDWVIPHLDLDKSRVERSDLSAPILITNDETRKVVLDGAHRLMKAHQNGIKTLPSIEVSSEDLIKAKMNISKQNNESEESRKKALYD